MFGTRIRSWMEAHIVRARKKQSRPKNKLKSQETPHITVSIDEKQEDVTGALTKENSEYSVRKVTEVSGAGPHLSSPESAYSTGYSTDGTSPGASLPPEYYINLRTGKHYVQKTGNTVDTGEGRGTPGRRRREETKRRREDEGVPGSSTEEDIAGRVTLVAANTATPQHRIITPKVQRKLVPCEVPTILHRRTESYDESQQRQCFTGGERDSEGSSSTQTTGGGVAGSLQCGSPFLSASPRQRNRIRTNPWLAGGEKAKTYNSQGETSSTVGSSSTLSSSGYKERPPQRIPEEANNLNLLRNGTFVASPLINGRRVVDTVTTCSPQPNRPCRHMRATHPPIAAIPTSSSSTSARSSGSDDNHHGNTSDFSDDDVTLNEMLGKYDESYVYEKETDILSDSDPTDCEEQHDYNDNSSHHTTEPQDDLDFIDTGSIAELANSDSEEPGKIINRGHCTYVMSANHTPEMCKRQCSRLRKHRGEGSAPSSRGSSVSNRRIRRSSSRRSEDPNSSSEITPKRYRKKRHSSKESRKSVEVMQKDRPGSTCNRNVKPPSPCIEEKKNVDPARHINLNKVLMQRFIENQRSGTRSADGTPVSLRRNGPHEYNGKYLKNPHVSKLINSNSSLVEKRTLEDKAIPRRDITAKRRSNSLTVTPPAVPPRNMTKVAAKIDKEGDMKYRKLIQEAEHIIEDFSCKVQSPDYLSPTLSTKSAIFPAPRPPPRILLPYHRIPDEAEINSQINLLQETINNNPVPKIDNEEGIFKTISKTLEKIIRNSSDVKKCDKSDTIKSKKKSGTFNERLSIFNHPQTVKNQGNYVNNPAPVDIELPDSNDNLYKDIYDSNHMHNNGARMISQPNHYDRTFKNIPKGVDIVRNKDQYTSSMISNNENNYVQNPSSSWTGRQTICEIENGLNCNEEEAATPLNSFKSFDLGNRINENSKYCPQSEPVKRKVYVNSSTFDKLQKSLKKSSQKNYQVPDLPTEALRDENITLKEKVAQLRRERLQVEARVRETQEQIDRLRLAETSSHC